MQKDEVEKQNEVDNLSKIEKNLVNETKTSKSKYKKKGGRKK